MRARSTAVLTTVALVLAACGGDDGAGPLDRPAEVDTGSLEETRDQVADALEEAGIDPDALDGLDLDDIDPENLDLDELQGELDEFISGFGGDGGGTVVLGDVTYTVVADVCLAFADAITVDGPAQGSDGSVAWISVDRDISTRDEMLEFMDEDMVDLVFGDADVLDSANVTVAVGATGRFDDGDEQWDASSGLGFGAEDLEYRLEGTRFTATGTAMNWDSMGEERAISVDVACD